MPRIYTVFTTSGLMGECQTFQRYHPATEIVSNDKIMAELKNRCEGVEFVGQTAPINEREAIGKIKNQKDALDGVLFFGPPSEEIISLDVPIVAVYPLWGRWMCPFSAYKGEKVITSCLPVIPDNNEATFSSRFDDIASKIKVISAISKLKGLRVLVVTDEPVLGKTGDYEPIDIQMDGDPQGYEEIYLRHLEDTFHTNLVVVPQQKMVDRMKAADEGEAEKIAAKWIGEAEEMKGTNKASVIESAKLYLIMQQLMKEHDCQAVTTEGYTVFQFYKPNPIPSQGLASSQFCTDGIVATSETLIDSLITQQLGLSITGSTGFNGDYLLDTFNEIAIIGHCECPFNPYGDERKVSYVIRNLPLWEENKGGACVQVNLPVGEHVTVAKISVHDKKVTLFSGETVAGTQLFSGWDDILCRTKLAIKANTENLFANLDWKTFGNHRVTFYGDHRQKFIDLAALIGFEVIEDDK